MRITARTPLGRQVRCVDPLTGETLPVATCDTTQGWIDLYLLRPKAKDGTQKVFVNRKKRAMAKVRLHTEFDIVTHKGRKLISVRWTWSDKARAIETRLGPLPK
jgi:hypothetical protein